MGSGSGGTLSPGILAKVIETEYSDATLQQTPVGVLYIKVENIAATPAMFNGLTVAAGGVREYPFIGKGYDTMSYSAGSSKIRLTFII